MTEYIRAVMSAPEGRGGLLRSESSRSVSSEPSRLEDDEEYLSESETDESLRSASTGDVHSTYDGSGWASKVGSVDTSLSQAQRKLSKEQLVRHIRLKRQLEVMRKGVERKETLMEQYREQLSRCREHLRSLVDQCTSLEEGISREEQDKNTAAVGLLRSQLAKVHGELSSEEAVESHLQESLERAELELSEALLAWSKFEEVQSQLHQEEGVLKEVKGKAAMQRLQTQTRMMVNAERNVKTQDRLLQSTLKAQETTTRAAMERARQAQEEGREFLKQTLNRKRREEAVEGEKHRAHLERRMKALLSLKSNIEASQGTLQAQQMLVTEKQRKQKRAEVAERERIFTEGGNPDEELLKKRRIEEFARSKELYENKQRERQLEIVSQLLEEGKMERRTERKMAKAHWHNRQQAPHASTKAMHKQKKRRRQKVDVESVVTTPKEEASAIRDKDEPHSTDEEDSNVQSPHRGVATISDSEESLAKPEIEGLWEKKASQKDASQGEGVSKMEREMMDEAMEKLRKSVVVKQVAAGREFKGEAFLSKPKEVVFKDFDVGKIYRKRLQLTNVSYTVNHCKLLGVSNNLKDFISIDFNPPGSMSAGLTCQMTITFEPKLTEDLTGDIQFLSQTGPFSIPVHCLTKKCLVSVDRSDVDFGRVCVGETVSGEVILHNTGALPTHFQLVSCCKPAHSTAIVLEQRNSSIATGGQLSDQSRLSIMTVVEITNSTQGLDSDLDKLKSRSIGDLCSFSQRSITWSDQKDGTTEREGKRAGTEDEDDNERHSPEEGPPREGATQTEEGEVPSNLDAISIEGSQEILPILDTAKASAITIGKISEGELGAFSSRKLELVFAPEVAGSHIMEFQLSFSQLAVQPIAIRAKGEGLELPVYVERNVVDLQICMVGRLYQDSVTVYNRAVTALRITFQIPDELHPHLEVLPKYGLVQGESSFAAQLKFMPKADIFTKCHKYFKPDSGYLEVPVEIKVVDQTLPVPFTLRAQVTVTDIDFSTPSIDFGTCTTHESVVATLQITNKSILPQSFGFIHLPEVVDVQPNDGFGTLLPQETISLDVIFSASKPKEYSFELICKTGVDRTFKIPCRGVGVLPAMELSANAINFALTVINNITTARVMLKNPKLGRLNSAVIRGAVLPQGPKAFEFVVPEGFPIAVSPQVGVVPLGESVGIEVQFHPRLDPESIKEEAIRLAMLSQPPVNELKSQKSIETEETEQQRPSSRKKPRRQSSRQSSRSEKERGSLPSSSKASFTSVSHSKEEIKPPKEGSEQWWTACQNLLNGFDNRCLQLSIPCFVSSETPRSQLDTIAYRPEDTLYLEVTASIVRPGLVVVTDCGRTTIDFCNVGRGDTVTKTVTIKNISEDFLHLSSSLLDPHGPFELRNALRDIPPGGVHNLILKFSPQNGAKYYEPLKLSYGHASVLELKLVGTGVAPTVELSLEGDTLDMGHIYANDTVAHNLQLKNNSPLSVRYHIQLENLPTLKQRTGSQFRASNYNGQAVFNFVPFQGTIESGKTCEIAVSFSPDHQSPFYSDTAFITLNDQPCYTIHLHGQGWSNNLYILGGETIGPREESMAATVPLPEDQHPPPKPILVMFVCRVEEGGGKPLPVSRKLEIGCIKTPMVKKNSGDYVIEPIPNTQTHAKAFSIDPMKSSVEAGSSKTVTLTFNAPQDSSSQTMEASTNLTLKGDSVQVYRLLLRALVCE